MQRLIAYSPHLAAAVAAVAAVLLPYYGSARWFVAFPATSALLGALGIGPGAQAAKAGLTVPTQPAGAP